MKEYDSFRIKCREFVFSYIEPYASLNDTREELDDSVVEAMKRAGYFGAMIPQEYGGLGLNNMQIGILICEIGKSCSASRSLLTVHGMVALAILKWGSDTQRKKYLPKMATGDIIGAFALSEPEVGSDANAIQCTATSFEDNYIINGTKKWITMSKLADVLLVIARLEDKPTAFLVNTKSVGVSATPIRGLMGVRASMMAEWEFNDCVVSYEEMIGNKGMGFAQVGLYSLDYGRYTIAWGNVGACMACLEAATDYSRKRKQFGVPIGKHQLVQKLIAEMVVQTKAAELLCINAAKLKDEKDADSIMETWNAKYFSSCAAKRVVDNAVQIMGGNGVIHGSVVERMYRDVKISEIIEGSNQMHEILIANNIFNNNYN